MAERAKPHRGNKKYQPKRSGTRSLQREAAMASSVAASRRSGSDVGWLPCSAGITVGLRVGGCSSYVPIVKRVGGAVA
jgi:hypothetical protein